MLNDIDKKNEIKKPFHHYDYNNYNIKSDGSDGLIIGEDISAICSEDEAYEYFCNIADAYIGSHIHAVAKLETADNKEREQLFRSRIRAIYRASVWGQFSLLCTGITGTKELSLCSNILNEAFCELESEGREFNGFIRKGICIDTPMLLYGFPLHSKFDFLCFDFYRLLNLCTGKSGSLSGAEELSESIRRICAVSEKNEASLKVYANQDYENIIKFLSPLAIKEIYFFKRR